VRPTEEQIERGKQIYFTECVWCHGVEGAGDGPAADRLWPRPRNFTQGIFKIRHTASGELPLIEDLFETVTHGLPGSVMPSWEGVLSEQQRRDVVAFIVTELVRDRKFDDTEFETFTALQLDTIKPIPPSPESVKKGAVLFKEKKCVECHGLEGRGDGNPINLKDDWGFPIQPRNLHKCWNIRGNRRDPYNPKNIFRTFSTGLNGTPMPSFADNTTIEERWHLANFVISLCERDEHGNPLEIDRATNRPKINPVIPAKFVRSIPSDPQAAEWKGVPKRYIALGGQISHKPRNFVSLNVDDLWVRVLYNQQEVAFLLQWDDRIKDMSLEPLPWKPTEVNLEKYGVVDPPSRTGSSQLTSPEKAALQEYAVIEAHTGEEGSLAKRQHTYPTYNDAVALQFPVFWKGSNGQPQFTHYFWGDPKHPADLIKWSADGRLAAYKATGWNHDFEERSFTKRLKLLYAGWKNGRWTVIISRPLSGDPRDTAALEPRGLIPTVFFVWDGHNGDAGRKMLVSPYYFLFLQPENSKEVKRVPPQVPSGVQTPLPKTFEVLGEVFSAGKSHNPFWLKSDGRFNASLVKALAPQEGSAHLIKAEANPWDPQANDYLKAVREGGEIYFQNCHFCHADNLNGTDPPTGGFWGFASLPRPTDLMRAFPLAQQTELYEFWRVAKGGFGLPKADPRWARSTMPAMEEFLSVNDMWKVLLFTYWRTGTTSVPFEEKGMSLATRASQ
ncbi:MAG: hypothetical protein D6704_00585, partial [Nitrospirae bacterium]